MERDLNPVSKCQQSKLKYQRAAADVVTCCQGKAADLGLPAGRSPLKMSCSKAASKGLAISCKLGL